MAHIVALLGALVVVLVAALPASAGKAELLLSPEQPQVGQPITVYGCGFVPSAYINVYWAYNYDFKHWWGGPAEASLSTFTDAEGCFSMTRSDDAICQAPCLYSILAVQYNKPGKNDPPQARIVFEIH